MSARSQLAFVIRRSGPLKAYRVSSARTKGGYPYWGVAEYRIDLTKEGEPCAYPVRGATSRRRSMAAAKRDALDAARSNNAVMCQAIGRLEEVEAEDVLKQLGYGTDALKRTERRARLEELYIANPPCVRLQVWRRILIRSEWVHNGWASHTKLPLLIEPPKPSDMVPEKVPGRMGKEYYRLRVTVRTISTLPPRPYIREETVTVYGVERFAEYLARHRGTV